MRTPLILILTALLVTTNVRGAESQDAIPLRNWPVSFDRLVEHQSSLAMRPVADSLPSAALQFIAVTPCRIADTRNANGTYGGPILAAAQSRSFNIAAASCGVPVAAAYSLSVTVTGYTAQGNVTVYPTGTARPITSTLNFASTGPAVANAAIVSADASGSIDVYPSVSTHIIIDINGYFVDTSTSSNAPNAAVKRDANGDFSAGTVTAARVVEARGFSELSGGATGTPSVAGSLSNGGPTFRGESSLWTVTGTLPQALTIDLGNATPAGGVPIDGVTFGTFWREDGRYIPAGYTIELSVNGSQWTTAVTVTGNTDVSPATYFPEAFARYIRLSVTAYQSGQATSYISGLSVLGTLGGALAGGRVWSLATSTGGTNNVVLRTTGNVGIGTATPTERLDVDGNLRVSGTITGATVINAVFQDLAEYVPAAADLDPGTVVVLRAGRVNEVAPSSHAYDTAVAGVVSFKPGIILGIAAPGKEAIATTGRVRVHVDAMLSPIEVGDLLVTSDVVGTAMKSRPLDINGFQMHRPGTIVGKALEPLVSGRGDILVLLSMQ